MIRTRALRRYYQQIAKQHARRLAALWHLPESSKTIGRLAKTRVPCSCPMCGNPRRHFGLRTHQELATDFDHVPTQET